MEKINPAILDSKGNKPVCLNCQRFPCKQLEEAAKHYEAPSISWTGACKMWIEKFSE